ncbi:CPBP family intramembrane glutamic endopeptidase [Methanobrevibacter wolinii]|uniref:CPBP family intramembrane glutamic endopeptidase n=1 Tax=Methanobrevibacter wolinii TaxID=190977 RepID=UPI00069376C2|nr:type II CAAX endopeptidase family protein [Methanobrevibacter wolinii]
MDETNNSNDLNFTVDSKPKIDYKKEKTTLSKVGVSYFLLLLIMFFVPTLLLSVFPVRNNDILLLFNFFGFIFGFIILYYSIKKIPKADNFKKENKLSLTEYIYYLIMGYGLMLLGYFICNIIKNIFVPTVTNPLQTFQSSGLIGTFLYGVLFGPIFEEYFFRKFLIDRTIRYGELFAVLSSAFMFMIYHMNFYQFLGVFLFGFVLAHVYVKTKNILYTITMHQIANFLGLIVPSLVGVNPLFVKSYNLIAFIIMCLSIGFFVYYLYKVNFKQYDLKISNKKLCNLYFNNFGIIIFLIFGLVIAILNLNIPWIMNLFH